MNEFQRFSSVYCCCCCAVAFFQFYHFISLLKRWHNHQLIRSHTIRLNQNRNQLIQFCFLLYLSIYKTDSYEIPILIDTLISGCFCLNPWKYYRFIWTIILAYFANRLVFYQKSPGFYWKSPWIIACVLENPFSSICPHRTRINHVKTSIYWNEHI